ncbi:hypothetical protein BACI349Y_50382 [Bacillus sp. 349Y]|nr:hypothetical protein BACI349Y_50382 [Bacillus sp. 349Y]
MSLIGVGFEDEKGKIIDLFSEYYTTSSGNTSKLFGYTFPHSDKVLSMSHLY